MSQSGSRILIVDDEPQIRKLLRVTLQAHGYAITEAQSGADGIVQAGMDRPELIILDLGLPDMDGLQVLRQIREWSQVPILVVTVREREDVKVSALDFGADDYITKPFGMKELLARIRVGLRHAAGVPDEPLLHIGDLMVDRTQRLVELRGNRVKLTPIEYDLLKVLATHSGRVVTHRYLLQQVWGGQQYETESHYLRIYIGHLRRKLEADPNRPQLILTEPGVGYRLHAPE